MLPSKGKFITFEGGEGGGKSTQSTQLYAALKEKNIPATLTREPGGTDGAEAIRELLVKGDINRWDYITEMLLHLAARRDHVVKKIQPALNEGTWVLCDRFIDSTMAYQGYGHELGSTFIDMMHNLTHGSLRPDLTILLDIDPEKGIHRTETRHDDENRYEKMDKTFHTRLRDGFLAMAEQEKERFLVIDATKSIDAIHKQIMTSIQRMLER